MSMEAFYKTELGREREESALVWEVLYRLEKESCHDRHRAGMPNHGGYTCLENQEGDGEPIDPKLLCSRCFLTWTYQKLDALEAKRKKREEEDGPQDDRWLDQGGFQAPRHTPGDARRTP